MIIAKDKMRIINDNTVEITETKIIRLDKIRNQIKASEEEANKITLIEDGRYPDEIRELISQENFNREDRQSQLLQEAQTLRSKLRKYGFAEESNLIGEKE